MTWNDLGLGGRPQWRDYGATKGYRAITLGATERYFDERQNGSLGPLRFGGVTERFFDEVAGFVTTVP